MNRTFLATKDAVCGYSSIIQHGPSIWWQAGLSRVESQTQAGITSGEAHGNKTALPSHWIATDTQHTHCSWNKLCSSFATEPFQREPHRSFDLHRLLGMLYCFQCQKVFEKWNEALTPTHPPTPPPTHTGTHTHTDRPNYSSLAVHACRGLTRSNLPMVLHWINCQSKWVAVFIQLNNSSPFLCVEIDFFNSLEIWVTPI